jgi:hypothetical protein
MSACSCCQMPSQVATRFVACLNERSPVLRSLDHRHVHGHSAQDAIRKRMRFRIGKFCGAGGVGMANSEVRLPHGSLRDGPRRLAPRAQPLLILSPWFTGLHANFSTVPTRCGVGCGVPPAQCRAEERRSTDPRTFQDASAEAKSRSAPATTFGSSSATISALESATSGISCCARSSHFPEIRHFPERSTAPNPPAD